MTVSAWVADGGSNNLRCLGFKASTGYGTEAIESQYIASSVLGVGFNLGAENVSPDTASGWAIPTRVVCGSA